MKISFFDLLMSQQIGLPILPTTPSIMRSIHSDTGLSKKVIIARVINDSPDEIVFTEKQMDQFYDLAVKCRNNSISKEELVMELRGGGIEDLVGAFGIVIVIIEILLACKKMTFAGHFFE